MENAGERSNADKTCRAVQPRIAHVAIALFLIAVTSTVYMVWRVGAVAQSLVEQVALEQARLHTNAIAEFRTLYTSEVVGRAQAFGLSITHDYRDRDDAIPLPATLSMELGEHIARGNPGVRTLLYSPYPFAWRRETGGLRDDFGREAWQRLVDDPHKPFYRIETLDGRVSLRYATADVMRASCVACHNEHPSTPRKGWREGDVRGVLEVVLPIDFAAAQAQTSHRVAVTSSAVLVMCGLLGLMMVVRYFRRTSIGMQHQAQELRSEVSERKRIESALRSMTDMQKTLLKELDHRVKNNLAGLLALVDFGRRSDGDIVDITASLTNRILAMKLAHELIARARARHADLQSLLEELARHILAEPGRRRAIHVDGEPVGVETSQASAFAMIFQELLTNSQKHGALSVSAGRVDVAWTADEGHGQSSGLRLTWRESGGPPPHPPEQSGMGLSLIEGFCKSELRGTCSLSFESPGFSMELTCELDRTTADMPGDGSELAIGV